MRKHLGNHSIFWILKASGVSFIIHFRNWSFSFQTSCFKTVFVLIRTVIILRVPNTVCVNGHIEMSSSFISASFDGATNDVK